MSVDSRDAPEPGPENGWASPAPEAGTTDREPDRILVVEDDPHLRGLLAEVLEANGFAALSSPDGRHALRTLQREIVDLVVTDLQMPGLGGEELLEQVRATYPEIPVIAMTSFGSIEGAVKLTRAGASDYLPKPLRMQAMLETIRRVLDASRPQRELLRARRGSRTRFPELAAPSLGMTALLEQVERVAPSTAPVLVTGETGTGKELIAQALHRASGRHPFVPVNCGAISPTLLESELFGHARGAFTGADRDKTGLFEAADGGTLFLDEIAELPLALQPKLLRALQLGEIRRVGDVEPRHVSVRVIAATHRDLAAAVRQGEFREDLYYRVNVIHLEVPPLRERRPDLPLLAARFLAAVAAREGRPEKRLAPGALAALAAYAWPGNVRELQNAIERVSIFTPGDVIQVEDLPPGIRAAAPGGSVAPTSPDLTLAELERQHIVAVLERVGGNRSRAAEVLGVPRRTLYRRLEEYGI